jgi:hypothetical protein
MSKTKKLSTDHGRLGAAANHRYSTSGMLRKRLVPDAQGRARVALRRDGVDYHLHFFTSVIIFNVNCVLSFKSKSNAPINAYGYSVSWRRVKSMNGICYVDIDTEGMRLTRSGEDRM